jgi:hypothetical protein
MKLNLFNKIISNYISPFTIFVLTFKVDSALNASVILALGFIQGQPDPLSGREIGRADIRDGPGHFLVPDQDPSPDTHRHFGHFGRKTITLQLILIFSVKFK